MPALISLCHLLSGIYVHVYKIKLGSGIRVSGYVGCVWGRKRGESCCAIGGGCMQFEGKRTPVNQEILSGCLLSLSFTVTQFANVFIIICKYMYTVQQAYYYNSACDCTCVSMEYSDILCISSLLLWHTCRWLLTTTRTRSRLWRQEWKLL